jgi:hypothetical protein
VLAEGPGDIKVVLGHPRTLLIRGVTTDEMAHHTNLRDKTIVVDGTTAVVSIELERFPTCRNKLSDAAIPECRRQFCENHGNDPGCTK